MGKYFPANLYFGSFCKNISLWFLDFAWCRTYYRKSCYRSFKGGATVSTGIVEAVAACRGSYRPRKTGRINIIADNYDYALAA